MKNPPTTEDKISLLIKNTFLIFNLCIKKNDCSITNKQTVFMKILSNCSKVTLKKLYSYLLTVCQEDKSIYRLGGTLLRSFMLLFEIPTDEYSDQHKKQKRNNNSLYKQLPFHYLLNDRRE